MLERQQQNAITAATRDICNVFRGVSELGDCIDFAMAMLLLKFLSDIEKGYVNQSYCGTAESHFIVPEASRFQDLFAGRTQAGNGERIDKALHALEEANVGLQGIFQGISFSSTRLGNAEQKERVLGRLLEVFNTNALDFRVGWGYAAEAAAYACESLIRQVAEIRGKRGGEFFTPPELSQLIARLMQPAEGDTICDPCCGSGSLLISCRHSKRQQAGDKGCTLFGQEKNGSTWALAKMNMIFHGETQHQLEWGDTLRDPKLFSSDGSLRKFEIVVSSPPFTLKDWGQEEAERDIHRRYWRGLPPRAAGDYAFISHMVETLAPKTGRMAAVVSLGVLFRGAAEQQIRKQLLKENLIDAVIALPTKMFPHTSIPVAILVVRKDKVDDSVLFIDASRSYQYGKTQNVLRPEDLDRLSNTYHHRRDVSGYARCVRQSEIVANDCNLTVTRYVDAAEEETEVDLIAIRAERARLKVELASLEIKLARLLEGIDHA